MPADSVIRVFLVEDIQRMEGLLRDLFDSISGYRIDACVGTEAEAYLWLDEHPNAWDLAVVDLVLQQGSGMSVVSRARKANPQGKVVVLSSYATPGVRAHCISRGADAVFDKSEPQAFINYCLELSRVQSELASGQASILGSK